MLRVLGAIVGVILLLPGVCSLRFMAVLVPDTLKRPSHVSDLGALEALWLFCFAISFGGILMIRAALRRSGPTPPRTGDPPPGA